MTSFRRNGSSNLESRTPHNQRRRRHRTSLLMVALVLAMVGADLWSTEPDRAVRGTARYSVVPAGSQPASTAAPMRAGVAAADRVARESGDATMGTVVLDRKTGQIAGGEHADEPLYTASVVKLVVAVDVLERAHTGEKVDRQDRRLIRRALGPSDDEAMNQLWTEFDGPDAVERAAEKLDLAGTRPPEDASQWGQAEMSAYDVAALYQHILTEMPKQDRDFIMSSLRRAPRTATGGFDQRFGIDALRSGAPAAKAGWMCCDTGELTLHSAGVLGESDRYIVALLSRQPTDVGYDEARAMLSEAAEAVDSRLR